MFPGDGVDARSAYGRAVERLQRGVGALETPIPHAADVRALGYDAAKILYGSMEKVATGVYLLKPIPPRKGGYDGGDFDS